MHIYKHLYRIWLRKLHSLKWIVHFHLVLMVTRQQKNSKAMKRGVKYFYKFLKQNTFSLAIRVMQQNFFDKIQTSIFKGVQSPQILSSLNCAISLNWAPVFKHIFFRTSTSHLNLDYVYPSPTLPNKMIHVYRRHNVLFYLFWNNNPTKLMLFFSRSDWTCKYIIYIYMLHVICKNFKHWKHNMSVWIVHLNDPASVTK